MADDPFFADEDGDDFDDLYGKPAPALAPPRKGEHARHDYESASDDYLRSPAPSSHSSPVPKSRMTIADTPSDWSSSRQQPRPSASVASSQGEGERFGKMAKGKGKKVRRKGSQELFDVEWEDEARVSACSICASGFSLLRRKHHCRPCGRVMCSECSSFLFFEASQRKHRVCSACAADHAAATRAARQLLRDTLFDDASDSEPQRTPMATTTPSSVTSDKRGGFRTSLLHAITPKSDKPGNMKHGKKAKKNSVPSSAQLRADPVVERSGNAIAMAEAQSPGTGPALFSSADDAWFAEPADEGEDKRKRTATSDMGRAFPDADYSDDFADININSNARTAADEWREQVKASYELQIDPTSAAPSEFGLGRKDFSEQYQYNDDPLDYDEDDKIGGGYTDPSSVKPSMPRPSPAASLDSRIAPPSNFEKPSHAPPAQEQTPDQMRQSVLKVNLKSLFHGKSKKEKRDRRKKSKESGAGRHASPRSEVGSPVASYPAPRTSKDQQMMLDDLEMTPKPVVPVATSAVRPTFYDDDADELVVDDTPGYFEASVAKNTVDRQKQEELRRKLAEDAAWVNGVAAPMPSGNRFSSGQESYSIVDAPSRSVSSPESAANTTGPSTREGEKDGEHGFTGALKRFFGMSSVKPPAKTPTAPTDAPTPAGVTDLLKPSHTPAPITEEAVRHSVIPDNNDLYAQDRGHSFRDSVGDQTQQSVYDHLNAHDGTVLRYTMASNVDAQGSLRPGTFMVPDTQPTTSHRELKNTKSSKSLKRRDTFDDLFESPKAVDRHNDASSGLPVRSWGDVPIESTPAYSVSVSRFDAYQDDREGEVDDFMPRTTTTRASDAYRSTPSEARYNSAPTLKTRRDSDDAFGSPTKPTSAFTWSSVQASPSFGTASYAVPAGIPPRDSWLGGDQFASSKAESDKGGIESPHNIMQDLHQRSASAGGGRKRSTTDSVDDIFAQFEQPKDYVFDAATGSYVPARPAHHPTRRDKEVASATRRSYEPSADSEPRSSVERRSSERSRSECSYEARPVERPRIDKDGENSESNESDDVIVDKISSLEGELAALKRLIKKRKGGTTNPAIARASPGKRKPKAGSTSSAKPRKASIFDGDSSESDKELPSSRWPTSSTRELKAETAKLPPRKARRDSFASLFDDDPADDGSIAGAGGYDALFQTGADKSGDSSGEDKDASRSPAARRSGKRKPSKKFHKKDAALSEERAIGGVNVPDEDEEELTSLKNKRSVTRRHRSSKERRAPSWSDDSIDEASNSNALDPASEPKPASIAPSLLPPRTKAVDEEDSIDALFDASNDTELFDLYGDDTATAEVQAESTETEKAPSPRRLSSRRSKPHRRLSDDDNTDIKPAATPIAREGSSHRSTSSHVVTGAALTPLSMSTADGSDADSEEEFAINWKKVKSGRARRQTRAPTALSPPVSFVSATNASLLHESDELAPPVLDLSFERNETLAIYQEASEGANGGSAAQEVAALDTADEPSPLYADGTDSLQVVDGAAAERVSDAVHSPPSPIVNSSERDDDEKLGDPVTSIEPPGAVASSQADAESTLELETSATSSFTRSISNGDLFKGDDDDQDVSVGLFDRSNDVDLHALMTDSESTLHADNDALSAPDAAPGSLLYAPNGGDASSSGEEENGSDAAFSFEIQPQRRRTAKPARVETAAPRSEISTGSTGEDDEGSMLLGRYTHALPSRAERSPVDDDLQLGASFSSVDTTSGVDTPAVDDDAGVSVSADKSEAFDADWQAMQEQEKQRKKKLQMKQRQAQRDKLLLKKQHSKMLASSATDGVAEAKVTKHKKKKKKAKKSTTDDAAPPSSRKHRHREKEDQGGNDPDGAAAAAGSITEL